MMLYKVRGPQPPSLPLLLEVCSTQRVVARATQHACSWLQHCLCSTEFTSRAYQNPEQIWPRLKDIQPLIISLLERSNALRLSQHPH